MRKPTHCAATGRGLSKSLRVTPDALARALLSSGRFIISPIVDYVTDLEKKNPDRQIAVLVPELVEQHWYQYFLHNQRAKLLKAMLLLKGDRRLVLISIPWYLEPQDHP